MRLYPPTVPLRRLILVLGDQLNADSAALEGLDPSADAVLMVEAREEALYLNQHKRRIAFFFAAMRHFASALSETGAPVLYWRFDAPDAPATLGDALTRALLEYKPHHIRMAPPGDHRVLAALEAAAAAQGASIEYVQDRHFISTPSRFSELREGRKRFILEDFYRAERKRTGWLMEDGKPIGGQWNYDKNNRKNFGRNGPGLIPRRLEFPPDRITRDVLGMVEREFPDAPGALDGFSEPVTATDARRALDDFVQNRLGGFGDYQDAIAQGNETLFHSRLSAVLNVKLLDPRVACLAAIDAYQAGDAPLNAVEGFVRQILGWREFVRGVYWAEGPSYAKHNALQANLPVPRFMWTGETEMRCVADAVDGLLRTAYAHHIQRLMVLGLFLMLAGVHPYRAHEWHMEMYLDAIDWVSLPNVVGMSQHADGGIVGTKPYAASGAYISRMSDCCANCPYNPATATGAKACPFTTLYWDFLDRRQDRFRANRRMAMQMQNLDRKSAEDMADIRRQARQLRDAIGEDA